MAEARPGDRVLGLLDTWAARLLVPLVALVGVVSVVTLPSPRPYYDLMVNRLTVDGLRAGLGYYEAMDSAMRAVGNGPVESVRAFRLPTLYLAWSLLPEGDRWELAFSFVAVALLTGLLVRLAHHPIAAVLPAVWAIAVVLDYPNLVEVWAVVGVVAAMVAWREHLDWASAALALGAALIRETAALLILVLLVTALVRRRDVRPWLLAALVLGVAVILHAHSAQPWLVPEGQGREAVLFGLVEFPHSLVWLLGYRLPFALLGLLAWALAMWWVVRREEPMLALYLGFGLVGLVVTRPYWGVLILPLTLLWGTQACIEIAQTVAGRLSGGSIAAGTRGEAPT